MATTIRTRKRHQRQLLSRGIVFILLVIGIYALWTRSPLPTYLQTLDAKQVSTWGSTNTGTKIATVPVSISEIKDTGFLQLVNHDHGINSEPASKVNVSTAYPTVAYRSNDIKLQDTALQAVRELFAAAGDAKIKNLYISSGFRNAALQKQLYNEAADKSYVQTPNHSEHQTGLAVDIMATDMSQTEMETSRQGRWLADNSWKYGLILRYAQDKKNITQISYEPWHFRYVGQPHALYCQENNLCFEEYIQFLHDNGSYQASYNGKTYYVMYTESKNGKINVPKTLNYTLSNDNTGGYILTAWE